jgi:hypothetical protein
VEVNSGYCFAANSVRRLPSCSCGSHRIAGEGGPVNLLGRCVVQ